MALRRVLFQLLASLPAGVRRQVRALAIDGTSSTSLLVDAASGRLLAPAKLYDEAQAPEAVQAAKVCARQCLHTR
jgi:sugar (pentulose or hexulose) kinase